MRLAAEAHGAGRLPHPSASVTIQNPVCGDRIALDILLDDGRIARIGHETRACVLCQAAASLLSEIAPGLKTKDLAPLYEQIKNWLEGQGSPPDSPWESLAHFLPVSEFKSRHRCVLLPFEAARDAVTQAIEQKKQGG